MRALIVGGNGFIGSFIQDAFLSARMDVSVLDRYPERFRPALKGVHTYLGDLADLGMAQRSLEGVGAVVYCASTTVPQTSVRNPVNDILTNLVPFLNFLELAGKHKVRRIVFISSGGTVYGVPERLPVSEAHATHPIVSHGIVKLAMEKYLFAAAHEGGMEAAVLRLGNAYGERQDPYGRFGAVATFLGCMARRQPISIWGDGSNTRDYVHVRDIASAVFAAVTQPLPHDTFNIGTGKGYSLNALVELMPRVTLQPAPEVHRGESRAFDIPSIVLDCARAKEDLGWKAAVSMEEGVRAAWEWIRTIPVPH
jgi:UDP-glucose 4-epimerase